MSKIIKGIENGINIINEIPDDVPRISADGFGPALIGFPMTTVTLYQQKINEPTPEPSMDRKIIATVQVPTLSLIELAQSIQNALRENRGAVEASLDQMRALLNKEV